MRGLLLLRLTMTIWPEADCVLVAVEPLNCSGGADTFKTPQHPPLVILCVGGSGLALMLRYYISVK
jgi:hypothetical protein